MINYIGPCGTVPYTSQLDSGIKIEWQQKFCGIVSLYMVIDYWHKRRGKPTPSLEQVSRYALDIDGFRDDEGWLHTKLAETARHFDCQAVCRSWFARPADIKIMCNQGRLRSQNEADFYQRHVYGEFIYGLSAVLSQEVPVILSVKPKFGPNGTNHLVVVTGIDRARQHVLVHDPQYEDHQGENLQVSTEKILQYSNFNAILVYDEAVQP